MTDRAHAIDLYNHAVTVRGVDPAMAYRSLVSAVEADPGFGRGWFLLGTTLCGSGLVLAGISALERAVRCVVGPDRGDMDADSHHLAWVNLGHRLLQVGRIDPSLGASLKAVGLWLEATERSDVMTAGTAFAYVNLSLAYSMKDSHGVAERLARHGHELHPGPAVRLGLAFVLLFAGKLSEGLGHFEARFPHRLPAYESLPWPRWEGGGVEALVVMSEQGLGDTLRMSRFVHLAADRVERLIFMVQPELVRLLRDCWAEYGVEVVPQTYELPAADAWCSVFSLPVALGLTDERIRGTHWMPARWERFEAPCPIAHDGFNVAIAWAGSPLTDTDAHRSIPVVEFLPLTGVPGVQVWSVQVGPRVKDLHDAGMAAFARDLSPYIKDAADTAALLGRMDLVVCCESFVGHLAGALDVPCWVLASQLGGDWQIGRSGETALWYPRHRVFRQGDDRTWAPVMARVVDALKLKVGER